MGDHETPSPSAKNYRRSSVPLRRSTRRQNDAISDGGNTIIARVVLMALMSLTLLAGSATAECAWVLWTQTESWRAGDRRTVEWDFDRYVHDTRVACESALDKAREKAVKTHSALGAQVARQLPVEHEFFIRLGERMVIIGKRNDANSPDWSLVYNYACLPEAIDPRGPKR